MFFPGSFKVSTPTDREIRVARDFHAPRQLVFDAFTKPDMVRRWLLGPPGWTMPVCEIDLKVGGALSVCVAQDRRQGYGDGRYFSPKSCRPNGSSQPRGSTSPGIRAMRWIRPCSSRKATSSKSRITVLYDSKEARETARRSGMEHGMAAGYNRLEGQLSTILAEGVK
jgi:hypothetical protein